MSADFEAASTLAVLLRVILGMVFLGKHADDIIYAVDSFAEWISSNAVGILAFFFLVSPIRDCISGGRADLMDEVDPNW